MPVSAILPPEVCSSTIPLPMALEMIRVVLRSARTAKPEPDGIRNKSTGNGDLL